MILQALKEYYDRKVADPDSQMATCGFEWKGIPYILVLNNDGQPVGLNCTIEGSGKSKRAKLFLVPQGVKKASGISANLLWDNPEYVLGIPLKGNPNRVKLQHAAFVQRIDQLGNATDLGYIAVKKFLKLPNKSKALEAFEEPLKELLESGSNLTFQLVGEPRPVCEQEEVRSLIQKSSSTDTEEKAVCLVTGQNVPIERLHTAIKGVWGAQTSGANIVSFNLSAFKSYGKDQGANAPIGSEAVFSYTTALNRLLEKDSKQRIQVGDASTVFWSSKRSTLENQMLDFFAESPKDDPDRGAKAIESLFSALKSGVLFTEDVTTKFYVLGLAPNASRIAIRFWIVDTIPKIAGKICQHFDDTKIVHAPHEKGHLSLFRLLVSTAVLGKSENIPPNIAGETMRAILEGLPYPKTLLQAAIRRIRAEHEISYPRAALIKACLNRESRFYKNQKEEFKMSLDTENNNVGYRLGRLFATLEKIQQEASPGINATIRDKFYGAASGTPVTVFGNLMRQKNHHLGKIEYPGRKVFFEKLLGEIVSAVNDFPPHLKLEDQGRFAIGYYHQMQDFFTKKDKSEQ